MSDDKDDIEIKNGDIKRLPIKEPRLITPDGLPLAAIVPDSEQLLEIEIPKCNDCEDAPMGVITRPVEEKFYTFNVGYQCTKCGKTVLLTKMNSLSQWTLCAIFETTFNVRNHIYEHECGRKEESDDQ